MTVTWKKFAFEDSTILKSLLTEQGDVIYASAASTPAALPHGTAGDVLTSGGHGANPSWAAPSGGSVDYQLFTSSGTWTKPAGCTMVLVDVIGGGGSGTTGTTGGGGGGGARAKIILPASSLTSTVSVTVGAVATASGTAGNYSSFGSYVVAQGGEAGDITTNCAVGGCVGTAWAENSDGTQGGGIGGRDVFKASSSEWGGGSGGSGVSTSYDSNGGSSVYAGGGGASGGAFYGGTSGKFGLGGGGAPNTNGADGNLVVCGSGGGGGNGDNAGHGGTPGGGGGGGQTGYNSGNGARGEVRVWAW